MTAPRAAGHFPVDGPAELPVLRATMSGTAEAVQQVLCNLLTGPVFANVSPCLASNAEIVLAEVLNNIVEHAYATTTGDIALKVHRTDAGLACEVTDWGVEMPGLTLPQGAFQALGEIDDLPEGGFGWFLIRSLVEGLIYRREMGENRLSFLLPYEQSNR